MKSLTLTILIITLLLLSCQSSKNGNTLKQSLNPDSPKSEKHSLVDSSQALQSSSQHEYLEKFQPLTQQFYDGFTESQIDFSKVKFWYYKRDILSLNISSKFEIDLTQSLIISSYFNSIPSYLSEFTDFTLSESYRLNEMTTGLFAPAYEFISINPVYYFNGTEFNGEDEIEHANERFFEHENFIALSIIPPQVDPFSLPAGKTFVKSWEPGENPPVELLPLIGYLENILIPEIKQNSD